MAPAAGGDGGCGALAEYFSFLSRQGGGARAPRKTVVLEPVVAKPKVIDLEPLSDSAAAAARASAATPAFALADLLCLRPGGRNGTVTYDEYMRRLPRPRELSSDARSYVLTVELHAEAARDYAAACQDVDGDDDMALRRTPFGKGTPTSRLYATPAARAEAVAELVADTPPPSPARAVRKLDLLATPAAGGGDADVEAVASAAILEDAVRSLKKEIEWREARKATSLHKTLKKKKANPSAVAALAENATPKRRALGDATNALRTC